MDDSQGAGGAAGERGEGPGPDRAAQGRTAGGSLFRRDALKRRGRIEPIDRLASVSAPREWAVLVAAAVVLAGVGAWAVLGSVERSVRTSCLMMHPEERSIVVAPVSGVVAEHRVRPGDRVEASEPVASLLLPGLVREAALARARADALQAAGAASGEARVAAAQAEALERLRDSGEPALSPIGGTVAWIDVRPGDLVQAGDRVAAVVHEAASALAAAAPLDDGEAGRVRPGMRADVRLHRAGLTDSDGHLVEAVVAAADETTVEWLRQGPHGDEVAAQARGAARLTLTGELPAWVREGVECEARIVTGSQSPMEVLVPIIGAAQPN